MATDDPGPARARSRVLRRLGLPTLGQVAVIVAFMVLGVGLAYGGLKLQTKQYRSSGKLFVSANKVEAANGLQTTNIYIQSRVQAYVSFPTSATVLGEVKGDAKLSESTAALADQISADAPLNQTVLNIHVTAKSASEAQRICQAVSARTAAFIVSQETPVGAKLATAIPGLKVGVISPGSLPKSPQSVSRKLLLLIGLLGGFVVGAVAVALRELLNRRVRRPRDLAVLDDAPLIGIIPHDRRADDHPHAFGDGGPESSAQAYRQLRTNIIFGDIDPTARIISITSPTGGEGKTTTAVNLAASLVELGLSVCLVECDLRRPSLADLFGLDSGTGLSTHLRDLATLPAVTHDSGEGFSVIPAGPAAANPSQLLGAQRLGAALTELATRFDYVVVDTSSLLPFAGGAEAVLVADVTFVVVRAKQTRRASLERAVKGLIHAGHYGGVVLNDGRGRVRPDEVGVPAPAASTPVADAPEAELSRTARRRRGRSADNTATVPSTAGAPAD